MYGVPDDDDDEENKTQNKIKYALRTADEQESTNDLVIGNVNALYQNVDDIYCEPKRVSDRTDSGNYERIKSFIQTESRLKENSKPMVLFNEFIVSENVGYISSERN